jgi:hypothetical protein
VVKAPENAFGGACYCLGVDPAAFGPRRGRSAAAACCPVPSLIEAHAAPLQHSAFSSFVYNAPGAFGARRDRFINHTPAHPYPIPSPPETRLSSTASAVP